MFTLASILTVCQIAYWSSKTVLVLLLIAQRFMM